MNGSLVVRRYAKALYEASKEASALDTLMKDIETLDSLMFRLPEVRAFCLSGNPSLEKGRILVQTAFLPYLGELTGRTVRLLERNRRLAALPYLAEALREENDRAKGITRVIVESVNTADEQTRQEVLRFLKRRIPGTIDTVWRIREDLLGGMTFQWNNRILDLSLKNRLGKLKRILHRKSL